MLVGQQHRGLDLQGSRQQFDHVQRSAVLLPFERTDIRPVDPGRVGQRLLRQAALAPPVPEISC